MMNNLDKDYQEVLRDILDSGVQKGDRTGTGTISVFGRQIRHNMNQGFPLLTTKKMYWKGIVTELLWFLRGDTNIKYLVDNGCNIWNGDAFNNYQLLMIGNEPKKILPMADFIDKIKTDDKFAAKWGDLGPIYGKQWRSWEADVYTKEIDQIQNLINELKTNPDSRRLMVSAWNVGELNQMTLPPCHYGFQVYTRELSYDEKRNIYNSDPMSYGGTASPLPPNSEKIKFDPHHAEKDWDNNYASKKIPKRAISLMWNQRSVDTFLGLPFNIASYGLLLEIIAKLVNMVPDELIGNLGDVHLYKNHIEQAKEQLTREPMKLPTLNINTEFWNTESGECGAGPLDTNINYFTNDNFCKCLLEDIQLANYESHPTIKAPLNN